MHFSVAAYERDHYKDYLIDHLNIIIMTIANFNFSERKPLNLTISFSSFKGANLLLTLRGCFLYFTWTHAHKYKQ